MLAWCIHIQDRKDREPFIEDLKKYFDIKLFQAERSEDGKRGCYESHQKIMQLSKEEPYAIIFEDDAVPVNMQFLNEALRFAETHREWDILYLGSFPDILKFQFHDYGHVFRLKAAMTHAYMVSSEYMKKFAIREYDGTPVDNVFRNEARTFGILPCMFKQANTESDVKNVFSALAIKDTAVNFCEFYAREIGIPPHVWLGLIALCLLIINGRSL